MRLNGIIDAAVMGGLRNYEDAFFTDDYLKSHPEHELIISNLKEHIREQIEVMLTYILLVFELLFVTMKYYISKIRIA